MTVSVYEARTNFSALLDQIEKSKGTVTITRRNRAVAQLVAITHGKRSTVHKELCPIIPKGIDWTQPTQEEWENA
jgi:antitoxin (DNA-binding transcriptional repressor) of toxin-antitoxin stability system